MLNKLFLIAIPLSLHSYTIQSDYLSYQGDNIEISGSCELTHSEIKILSQKGSIEKTEDFKGLKKAHLEDHVLIKFPHHGLIQCDHASLDFEQHYGILKKHQGQIFYQSDFFVQSTPYPLTCRCNVATFFLKEKTQDEFKLKTLFLEGNLETTLRNAYHIKGEKAVICFSENSNDFLPSSIEITDSIKPIELSFPDASFFTQILSVGFKEEKITLKKTKGKIEWQGTIDCEIEEANYFFSDKFLNFEHYFSMTHPTLGELKSKGLQIEKIYSDNWKNFHQLKVKAPFDANYLNHHLMSHSDLIFNHQSKTFTIDTSIEKKPLVYRYNDIELLADQLFATMADQYDHFSRIHFIGNIKLRLKDPIYRLQYLLADEIFFFPLENRLEIIAKKDKKILFWTDEEKTALSCEKITICYDDKLKKRSCFFKGQIEAVIDKPPFFP